MIGIAETHIRAELDFLVEANMLRVSSERDYYEVNSDKASWKAGPRCKLGFDRACALTEEILDGDFCRRDTQSAFAQNEGDSEGDRIFEESSAENSEEHPVHAQEIPPANISESSQAMSPLRVMFNALREGWPPGIPSELIESVSIEEMAGKSDRKLTEDVSPGFTTAQSNPSKLTENASSGDSVPTTPSPKLTENVISGVIPASTSLRVRAPARASFPISSPSSQRLTSVSHTSPISTLAEPTEDAAKMAEGDARKADTKMVRVPAELMDEIHAIFDEERWTQWYHWLLKELRIPGRCLAAREALGDLKIRQDLVANGIGKPIRSPGAWWVSQFRRLSGHQRKQPKNGPR